MLAQQSRDFRHVSAFAPYRRAAPAERWPQERAWLFLVGASALTWTLVGGIAFLIMS